MWAGLLIEYHTAQATVMLGLVLAMVLADWQCDSEGNCCTGTHSPLWFSVQLHAPTTDAIEVSICCDQGTNDEDVPVGIVELLILCNDPLHL